MKLALWLIEGLSLSLMLRPTVSRPVSLGIKHPSGANDQIFISVWQFRFVDVGRSLWRDFLFRRLLRLAGSRWRYSTPPPHGIDRGSVYYRFIKWKYSGSSNDRLIWGTIPVFTWRIWERLKKCQNFRELPNKKQKYLFLPLPSKWLSLGLWYLFNWWNILWFIVVATEVRHRILSRTGSI
jgi:hypothetical protein